jgi:hypothetical protein
MNQIDFISPRAQTAFIYELAVPQLQHQQSP